MYLPDTNAFSRFLRATDDGLVQRMITHRSGLKLSVVVLAELEYGASKRPDIPVFRERVQRLRELVNVAPFTEADASVYGKIRAQLEGTKPNAQPIGPYDLMIAAQAIRLGAVLVTHNTREFERVPGLTVENWQGR